MESYYTAEEIDIGVARGTLVARTSKVPGLRKMHERCP
jgi:hypothetical protein